MKDNKLFALTALFDNPDAIMNAAGKVADSGYKNYDVNTPYPVHGMDGKMKLGMSKIGYLTITIGLTFMSLFLYFIYWTNNVDYPQIIGGKPYFAFPTYVPIMFEITILTGAVLSVVLLIAVFFKFPNNAHPIHDSDYAKRTSSDQFGIYIEKKDKQFDYDEVHKLFEELGAVKITPVYYDQAELQHKNKAWDPKFVIGLIGIAAFTSFSVYMHMNKLLFIAPFNWMMIQPRVDYGEAGKTDLYFWNDELKIDKKWGLSKPVKGTVARNFVPYYYDNPDSAAKYLVNTSLPTTENLELGKRKFLTYCSPCHGNQAMGKSRLKGAMPPGPSLHTDFYRNYEDGRLYHVITKGKGIMPGYEAQITRKERWAIINYIRTLQDALMTPGEKKEETPMAEDAEINDTEGENMASNDKEAN
jgi:mono/diheme cytochrome c family protein